MFIFVFMSKDRLKQIIFKELYKDLSNVEIIPYNDSIWFIDRKERYWYFELEKNGNLYWRYSFFNNFFKIFSMEPNQFEPIISEWVEEVLNHKVSTTGNQGHDSGFWVEEVLNHKVSTTVPYLTIDNGQVEEVLNHKVSKTKNNKIPSIFWLEEVLNHKVSKTTRITCSTPWRVEEVLNHKVSTTHLSLHNLHDLVKDVLNHKVSKTLSDTTTKWDLVEDVLNENPTE